MTLQKTMFIAGVLSTLSLADAALAQTLDTSPDEQIEQRNSAKITQETAPAGETLNIGNERGLDDAFQPKGIPIGSYVLFPVFEIGESYNNNFFASETNQEYDLITRLAPSFLLQSGFDRHSLTLSGNFEYLYNARHRSDNQFNSTLNLSGTYDIDKNNDITGTIKHVYRHEDRGSADDAGGKEPTPTMSLSMDIVGKHRFGKNTIKPTMTFDRSVFYDVDTASGTAINNSDRDRTTVGFGLDYSRELYPGYAWVVRGAADTIRYDSKRDDLGYNRNSVGGELLTGVGVELTNVMRGDVLVGYMARHYEDKNLNDPMGMAVQASIHWTPTKLTIVSPSIRRSFDETTLGSSSSVATTTAALTARHELARDTLLGSTVSYSYRDFDGVNRQDNIFTIEGQVTHAFTPETYLRLDAGFKKLDSNSADSSYDQAVVGLTFGLRM